MLAKPLHVKVGAVMIALFVLSLVPAAAFRSEDMYISANRDTTKQGQLLTFFSNLNIVTNNEFRVHHMSFIVTNENNKEVVNCHFRSDDSRITKPWEIPGCEGIKKIKVIKGRYNKYWGYHYGQQEMWIKIALDTDKLEPGDYEAVQWAAVLESGETYDPDHPELAHWYGADVDFTIVDHPKQIVPLKTK